MIVALGSVFILATLGPASSGAMAAQPSKLVEIRAAHHPGFDRIVFEFRGTPPDIARARWATTLRMDPSHRLAHVQGSAFIRVRFFPALAHDLAPPQDSTFGPARRAYALPNIAHVVLLGDHEAEVSVGIGLMKRTRILRAVTLRKPSRFVVDVATDFKKGNVKVYFIDEQAFIDGTPEYVVPVKRKVPRGARAEGAMQRLYAGPTQAEIDADLRLFTSKTKGFRDLWINARGIARVTLRGPCDSGGAASTTIATHIMPTLRSRPAIDWVKIYDKTGHTLWPWGRSDSLPGCLQP
ncbi:MAG: hypothetical protein U9O18_01685 [Chloroflexota bacterium]|nr:hypothetical protein [Chloroflexota bacterium]